MTIRTRDDHLEDREALAFLYHATGGPGWRRQDNWLTAAPLAEWHGVSTGEDRRVSSLNLGQNSLNGEIPADLAALFGLEELALNDNQLQGEVPPELGRVARLRWLDLGYNRLGGEVPRQLET